MGQGKLNRHIIIESVPMLLATGYRFQVQWRNIHLTRLDKCQGLRVL